MNTLLTMNPSITDIVGEAIYPEISPQDTELPRIVFICSTEESVRCQSGCSGLVKGELIIEIRTVSSSERRTLVLAVQNALNGLKHRTIEDFECRLLALTNTENSTEAFQDDSGSDNFVYLAVLTFSIWFTESIPTTP